MADGNKRGSALDALRAGATIIADSGSGVGESEAPQAGSKKLEGKGSGTGRNTGTAPAPATGTGPANPATIFGAKSATDYESVTPRQTHGTHPRTGESVEIDYSQPGASAEAPFGVLPDGTPRQKRPRQPKGIATGSSKAAKSEASMSVLADAIFFLHTAAAGITKHTHWAQTQEEAKQYADALTDLQSAYGFDVDPKQAAWMKALVVIGMPTTMRIYASVSVSKRNKLNPAPAASQQPAQRQQAEQPMKQVTPQPRRKAGELTPAELFAQNGARFTDDGS
jgi:hypothetical protein